MVAALALAVLDGCALSSTLRYTPDHQPAGVLVSADYAEVGDRLRVELDTGGYRIEDATIVKPDGAAVAAEALEQPDGRDGGGLTIGVGAGSARRTGSVGVGAGVGTGPLVGDARRGDGNGLATFPLAAVGPPPWRLRVKLAGIEPVDIVLDPARGR